MNNSLKKIIYLFYGALFFYLFILQLYHAWNFSIDDAFISFRYAKNLANGQGFSWNINDTKVEGFSNFSYVLLQALLIKLNLPLLTFIKLFSIGAMISSLSGLYFISKNLTLNTLLTPLPSLLLIMHPGTILWGISGLETPFYQALVIFSSYFLLKGHSKIHLNKTCFLISGFILSIAGLTRPEAPLLLVSFMLIQIYFIILTPSTTQAKLFKKQTFYFLLGFAVIYTPYFFWRYYYFGYLFPNTVYCKFNNAPSGTLKLDIEYLSLILPLVIIMLPYLINKKDIKHTFLWLPSIIYLIALYNADWIVGFWHRHFLAVYPLILPLVVCSIAHIIRRLKLSKTWQLLITIIYSLLCGIIFTSKGYQLRDYNNIALAAHSGNELRENVSHWLNKNIPENKTIALSDCGLIPYLTEQPIIDSYCLNNASFSQAPIKYSYKRYAQNLLSQIKPPYIILLALIEKNQLITPPADLIIQKSKMFINHYQSIQTAYLLSSKTNYFSGYKYEIFKRIDISSWQRKTSVK